MKRRILLADDSVTIQKVIELTFMDEDYEVRAVSNGDEAVALLPEAKPDFVIADVHMPGANGYEVCRRSKQHRPDVPVLLLVGTFEPFDEAQARAAGADSFLKKPFDSQELLQRVGELLAARAAPAVAPAPEPEPAAPAFEELPLTEKVVIPGFAAAPAWGNFELEAEPETPPAPPAPIEPFEREVAFNLEPEVEAVTGEPVFELEEAEESFSIHDEVFAAPAELALDEAPPDVQAPAAPAPAPVPVEAVPAPAPVPAEAVPAPAPAPSAPAANGGGPLSDADVDRIARRVVELLGDKAVRDVAWEVIPDMAEVIIRDRLRELESQVE
ncbi:MAG TPA: response regulator [Thermoanaerobaculia bacterium]